MLTPLNIAVAATVQPDGTATFTQPSVSSSEVAVVLGTLQVAGNPTWTMSIGGVPVAFAVGPQAELGPRLVAPGEKVTITLTGALPGGQVTGQLHGGRSSRLEEVVGYANLVLSNLVSLVTTTPRQRLYPEGTKVSSNTQPSLTLAPGATSTPRFLLPLGCVQLRFTAEAGGVAFNYSIGILGVQDQVTYYPPNLPGGTAPVAQPVIPFTIAVNRDWVNEVDVTLTAPASNAATVTFYVSALFVAEAPGQAGDSQSVTINHGDVRPSTYDWYVDGTFAAAGTPQVVKAAPPSGHILVVAHLSASILLLAGAGAATPQLQLFDGASPIKRSWALSLTAAAAATGPVYEVSGLAYPVLNAATWQWDRAIGANQFATLDMAGYLV